MCRGPSTPVRTRARVQGWTGYGEYGNLGSVPGTCGCGVPGLYEYRTHGSSDWEVPGGLGASGSQFEPLVALQELSRGHCSLQRSTLPAEA